jgi:protocatechuate 3,4-dioxygenase beta subunit
MRRSPFGIFTLVAVLAVVALCLTVAADDSDAPSISGVIRDPRGKPVQGAHVEARLEVNPFEGKRGPPKIAQETMTGADGSYTLAPLPPAQRVLVLVRHPDWAIGGGYVEPLEENEHRAGVDFKLAHAVTASGVVVDERGQPIEEAVVTLNGVIHSDYYNRRKRARALGAGLIAVHALSYGGVANTESDANGRFTFTHLPKDTVAVGVRAERKGYGMDYAWSKESYEKALRLMRAGEGASWIGVEFPLPCDNIRIVLKKAGTITGRVLDDSTGQPVEGAMVRLQGTIDCPYESAFGRPFWASMRTDASGSFRIEDLPAILVMVSVDKGNLVGQPREVRIQPGEVYDGVDFELVPAGAIEGTAYDAASERPIANLAIRCSKEGVWGRTPSTLTDAKGIYRIDGLVPGEWQLRVHGWRSAESHDPLGWAMTVMVSSGQTSRNDLHLEKVEEQGR